MIAIFLMLWSNALASNMSSLQDANSHYADGNYALAAELYVDLIEDGNHSGGLYYNLGNTFYRNGQNGRAILAWQIARQLGPRNADTKANIDFVRGELNTGLDVPETSGPLLLNDVLSVKEQAWMATVLLSLVGLIGIVGRLRKQVSVGIPALLLGLPGLFLFVSVFLSLRMPSFGVILEQTVLRSEMGVGAGVVLRELPEGVELVVRDVVGNYALVELVGNGNGWVATQDLGIVDAASNFPL